MQGKFREGREATICIDDADSSVVAAVLKYAYTSEYDGADACAVLSLAHRYEIPELVASCVSRMVSDMTVDNVAQVVSAMNTFRDHPEVASVWPKVSEMLGEDASLRDSALRCVRA